MGTEKQFKPKIYTDPDKSSDFVIRRCTTKDLDAVIEVNEAELPEDYPYFFYKSILDHYPESFLVATDPHNKNKIVGYIMWRIEKTPTLSNLRLDKKGHLVSIAISQDYRRKRIATKLLKKSMPAIRTNGISSYVLEVRISNYSAIELYKKLDFKVDRIKENYYRDGENAYYMVKKV
ncbi:MAG: N-alpha-acetyltransferase [Promethearchaeota archaeon]|nr:MAG: N-alpha-acetyltransferase [Candidatus Lokiarchaeota archaeon]